MGHMHVEDIGGIYPLGARGTRGSGSALRGTLCRASCESTWPRGREEILTTLRVSQLPWNVSLAIHSPHGQRRMPPLGEGGLDMNRSKVTGSSSLSRLLRFGLLGALVATLASFANLVNVEKLVAASKVRALVRHT